MYKTDNYTRITCSKCKQEVTTLLPGETFGEIPTCKCFKMPGVITLSKAELREQCDKKEISYSDRDTIAILTAKLGI